MTDEELSEWAERWGRKNSAHPDDLYKAIAGFFVNHLRGKNDVEDLDKFLSAIRPPGGWREEGNRSNESRSRLDYGRDWLTIHKLHRG